MSINSAIFESSSYLELQQSWRFTSKLERKFLGKIAFKNYHFRWSFKRPAISSLLDSSNSAYAKAILNNKVPRSFQSMYSSPRRHDAREHLEESGKVHRPRSRLGLEVRSFLHRSREFVWAVEGVFAHPSPRLTLYRFWWRGIVSCLKGCNFRRLIN